MKWEKKGLIHSPRKNAFWNQKYDILPTPYYIEEKNIVRVFFGTTDNENYGRVTYVDLNASNLKEIIYEHDNYIIDLGKDGTFDDCGVVPSCIIKKDNNYLLYTVGFQRTVKTPYMIFPGLTISKDLKSFERVSNAPILPRNKFRYISQGAPCVIYDDNKYKMWHWYATKWINIEGKLFMDYHIGYAESSDAINWDMKEEPCLIPEKELGEFAVARPYVFKKNNIDYDIYLHTYKLKTYINRRAGEKTNNYDNDEYKLLSPKYLQIDDQDKIKENLKLKRYRTHPDPWKTNYQTVNNFILAQYSKLQIVKMVEKSEQKYDYLIYLRPDVKYIQKFNLNFFKHINNKTICIPNFHLFGPHKFNDRFCITNMNSYKIYGNIFQRLLNISKRRSLHSETVLGAVMKNNGLKTIRINFKFSRVRCDGSIPKKDRFKIK